ncbi:hypothetical protein OIU74_020158 [Salix koriyanagi]|uniref:Uncharacterized protein n=1 Tax=Salix koriyanagi TaxID=2511006 RepID=A0A9Q0P566_9ROSI|nr:hypothetical protein OIU74_020158 [Salix koriyanagi]
MFDGEEVSLLIRYSSKGRGCSSFGKWVETVEAVDDDETSLDDDVYIQKKQKGTKHKTRQAKALDNARKASKNSLKLLHEV